MSDLISKQAAKSELKDCHSWILLVYDWWIQVRRRGHILYLDIVQMCHCPRQLLSFSDWMTYRHNRMQQSQRMSEITHHVL